MKTLQDYILTLLTDGKYFFVKQEAISRLGLTQEQFRFQAYRLAKKKSIKQIKRDFFMIIPAEYMRLGALPPLWIIDPLMKYLKQDYYVGLLTAAAQYAATEQQPMVFQVITNKTTRPIKLERITIEFHVFKHCEEASIKKQTVFTGYVNVSTKEQTMLDLVRFYTVAGYLSNVALVIKSLAEECDPSVFEQIVRHEKTTVVLQRLGYILELLKYPKLATIVAYTLEKRKMFYMPLRPDYKNKLRIKSPKWKLILNDSVELS